MQIEDKVKKVVADRLGVDIKKVIPDAKFIQNLGADSLDRVDLILALEEHFGIKIEDGDAEKIETVNDAIVFIKKNSRG